MNLPQWTRHALNQKLEGVSRKELAVRAEALSVNYRAQGGSMQIRAELDALAYAMVRMPATWAAARHALNQVEALLPDWKPTSLFDAGAGPGTAAWAAIDLWSSLEEATLVDQNSALLSLARTIATACGDVRVKAVEGTIPAALASAPKADLVLASYALTELPAAKLSEALAGLWTLVGEVLVVRASVACLRCATN
jgi:ribosomal protein RSM22 (predicted rRNA methylase)